MSVCVCVVAWLSVCVCVCVCGGVCGGVYLWWCVCGWWVGAWVASVVINMGDGVCACV